MKVILEVAVASENKVTEKKIAFSGDKFLFKRVGVQFDFEALFQTLLDHDGRVDVMCLSGLPRPVGLSSGGSLTHPSIKKIRAHPWKSLLVDGGVTKDLFVSWTIQQHMFANPQFFKGATIAFHNGIGEQKIVKMLSDMGFAVALIDLFFLFRIPVAINNLRQLQTGLYLFSYFLSKIPLENYPICDLNTVVTHPLLRCYFDAPVLVTSSSRLNRLRLNDLSGKTVFIDTCSATALKSLKEAHAGTIISCMPQQFQEWGLSYAALEGLIVLGATLNHCPRVDDVLQFIEEHGLKPAVVDLTPRSQTTGRFAFVIHPLSERDYTRVPVINKIDFIHGAFKKSVIKIAPLLPPLPYGSITGICSAHNGKKVEGDLYTLFETPRLLMKADPLRIYKKLLQVAYVAQRRGAHILGLGAYTKIVGDAGVTVAQQSPLPVTTGNSLSAAATLWAATFSLNRMGFVEKKEGIYQGTVMVVGATGSIGKVCAKLLAQGWKEMILVAPRATQLLFLKDEISLLCPEVVVHVCTSVNTRIAEADLIITTTSAAGKGQKGDVLDINLVKPGAVICDVARPFDISAADAVRRPDVLVVASGEVELPGDVRISCDIGLPGQTVYACLAETAVLAMEGLYECFTLSRTLNYEKVKQIDFLARKHGVRLAAIMGHEMPITEQEIELCRRHAQARRSLGEVR